MAVGHGQVNEVDITAGLFAKEYILWFERQENASWPEEYRPYIQIAGKGCRARIPEHESSRMIVEMIRHGWKPVSYTHLMCIRDRALCGQDRGLCTGI